MNSTFPESCVVCGNTKFALEPLTGTFDYEHLGAQVRLSFSGNASKCLSCGLVTEGQEIFDARERAVRAFLRLHTPQEILSLRTSKGLSQAAFCKISRIGIASLRRWESGSMLQNPAMDSLLYLLRFDENLERLKQRNPAAPSIVAPAQSLVSAGGPWRTLDPTPALKKRAAGFSLCGA